MTYVPFFKKIIKVSLTATFALSFSMIFAFGFFTGAPTAHAQLAPYTTLAPLPGTTDTDNCTTNCTTTFPKYLTGIFNFSIGLAALLAFVVISYGGFLYMTTDAIYGKEEGRKYITDAVTGLLLVIGAYAILYTINPQILNFDLNIEKPALANLPTGVLVINVSNGGSVTGGDVAVARPAGVAVGTCTNCQQLTKDFNIATNVSASGTGVTPAFGQELKNLSAAGQPITVTEAWPPTITHKDTCHSNGTCVDATIPNQTPATVTAFFTAAKNNGVNASFEVTSQALLDTFRAAGLPVSTSCAGGGTVCYNSGATGNHFHLK